MNSSAKNPGADPLIPPGKKGGEVLSGIIGRGAGGRISFLGVEFPSIEFTGIFRTGEVV